MKVKYFYTIYGEIGEDLQKRIPLGNYVYILNISGSDVCKIGSSSNVFGRIKQLRQIVKSVFPYIENSITYNVYISSPLKDKNLKRTLESELHSVFKESNIDGEWFKCKFSKAINKLKERELNYIDTNSLNCILGLFDDKIYKKKIFFDDFMRLTYLKPIRELGFGEFAKHEYPEFFKQDKYYYADLNGLATESDIINILKKFSKYIQGDISKSDYIIKIDSKNKYAYKREATKKINMFVDNYINNDNS